MTYTYKDKLCPWCIIRPLPDSLSAVVARFRRKNDAEAHLKILRQQMVPVVSYTVIFSPVQNSPAPAEQISPV